MSAVLKTHTKKAIADAVSRVNAPRRTARYDVQSAWDALLASDSPADVLTNNRLREAREEINAEVERCTHTAPKFSIDGKVAVLRIESEAQVHPLIATRWANHLSSPNLDFVMVANSGYLPHRVNFSCRVARCARARDGDVDIIASLKAIAAAHPSGTLTERLGEDFARGHVQASGGIVEVKEFEELMEVMRVGEKKDKEAGAVRKGKGVGVGAAAQKNTLSNYFGTKKD